MFPLQPFNEDPPGFTSQNDKFIIREYLNKVIVPALNALDERLVRAQWLADNSSVITQLTKELDSVKETLKALNDWAIAVEGRLVGSEAAMAALIERLAILEEKVAGLTPCPDNPPEEEEPPPPDPDPDPEPEPDPPETPTLALSKTLMTFMGVEATAPSPSSDTSVATNSSDGTLNTPVATIIDPDGIIDNVAVNLTAAQTWDIVVTPTNPLPSAGVYNATVSVDSANNAGPAVAINIVVSSDVAPPPPPPPPPPSDLQLVANPTSLSFSAIEGGTTPAPKDVDLVRTGTGTLNDPQVVNITDPDDIVDTAVITPDAPQDWNLRVTPKLNALVAGLYTAVITVASVNQTNPPVDIDTQLLVSAPPPAFLYPTQEANLPTGITYDRVTGDYTGSSYFSGDSPTLPSNWASAATVFVNNTATLQAALNAAVPGTTIIEADPAGTYSNITVPAYTGTGFVILRVGTSGGGSMVGLPAFMTRINPATHAANMAKITCENLTNGRALRIKGAGRGKLWIAGFEFKLATGTQQTSVMVEVGDGTNDFPADVVFDRCYFHGEPTATQARRGLVFNADGGALLNCYFSEFHDVNSDSQAFLSYHCNGRHHIENNYFEGASENVMYGGAAAISASQTVVPKDVFFKRNHFRKPDSYKGTWASVKNILEFKHIERVLCIGNIFEGCWKAAQAGYGWNFKTSGSTSVIYTAHVTMRYNYLRKVGYGFALSGKEGPTTISMHHVDITDNIVDDVNTGIYTGDGDFLIIGNRPDLIFLRHNTMVSVGTLRFSLLADGSFGNYPQMVNGGAFTDNIWLRNTAPIASGGVRASGLDEGIGRPGTTGTLTTYYSNVPFQGNALIRGTASVYPSGNYFPTDVASTGFADYNNKNYTIVSGALLNGGTDGRSVGADIAKINALIAGVESP